MNEAQHRRLLKNIFKSLIILNFKLVMYITVNEYIIINTMLTNVKIKI